MHARYACCLSYRVSPAASLFRGRPFSSFAFVFVPYRRILFSPSLLLDRMERAFAPGTRLLPDREAIDRARREMVTSEGPAKRTDLT